MANVLSYINTGTFAAVAAAAGGYTSPPGMWCRPAHKPTCCVYITGDNSCCMCVPSSATCFVIEMWGQGGGGGGGCCCGVGSYGGQGGTYGWVACATGGQNWILCACACHCDCSYCSICSGTPGQFVRVCQCNGGINGTFWCVCGGNDGYWCCNPDFPWCWDGASRNPGNWPTGQKHNLWRHWTDRSQCLAGGCTGTTTAASSSVGYVWCCIANAICQGANPTPTAATYANSTTAQGSTNVGGGAGSNLLDIIFPKTTCGCFQPLGYVWRGACGWSDPSPGSSPAACLNGSAYFSSQIVNAACGGGMGVGGASYAGGHHAWKRYSFDCGGACWPDAGRFPGGGGMSSHSGTAWQQPGQGARGLILMSWC